VNPAPLAHLAAPERAPAATPSPRKERPLPALYERRVGSLKEVALREGGGSRETEAAVLAGLRYLASVQRRGGWFGDRGESSMQDKYGDVRIGKTGLAVLAFLGAGHTHQSGSEFSAPIARALGWLIDQQDDDSGHFGRCNAYGHGIATYALAECYAMSQDPALRAALEQAVAHVLAMQKTRAGDPRLVGGWTYYYRTGPGYDSYPRASVIAWQVRALVSARVGGLAVPSAALRRARDYFLGCYDEPYGYFRYNHDRSWLRSGYRTLPASTPASMFALNLLGESRHPSLEAGTRYVMDRLPGRFREAPSDAFVNRGMGNPYYWYYATLAMYLRGGRDWRNWNEAMKETLLPAQRDDGSWTPICSYGQNIAGDDRDEYTYTTALSVLILEVYYRYFTPLLQKQGRLEDE